MISHGLCQNPDIFDGTIRRQEAMFEIQVRPVAECAVEGLLHESAVVRMDALEYPLDGRGSTGTFLLVRNTQRRCMAVLYGADCKRGKSGRSEPRTGEASKKSYPAD